MDWNSAHGREVDARELARQRDYAGALASYQASLSVEPTYLPALSGAAELLYRRSEYDQALALTLRALAVDTYDPEANYLHGLVQRARGRKYDAREAFGIAARSRTYRPAALLQLAELAYADSDLAGAIALARRALDNDAANIGAYRLLAVAHRHAGDRKNAAESRAAMLATDPLSHFARCEEYLGSRSNNARLTFVNGIRNELPHETYLELASYYVRLGLWDDAQAVLALSPRQMLVDLWAARAAWKTGDHKQSSALLDRALAADPAFVFPHRQEDAEVLRWSLAQKEHWKPRYLLALLFWHYGRTKEAGEFFESCLQGPDFAPFYLARASFFKADTARALRDLREALRRAPGEWRTSALLATSLNEQADHAEALRVCTDATRRFPESYVLKFLLAQTMVMAGRYADARSILDTLVILPFEGSRIGREIYRQAHVLEAATRLRAPDPIGARELLDRARLWPERLGAGKPYAADDRMEDYLEARILRAQGDSAGAVRLLRRIVDNTRTFWPAGSTHQLIGALALRDMGNAAGGEKMLADWVKNEAANDVAAWSLRVFRKEKTGDLETRLSGSLLNPSSGDQEFLLLAGVSRSVGL
jgi:tetratricopeptide (TPR) repeat protein